VPTSAPSSQLLIPRAEPFQAFAPEPVAAEVEAFGLSGFWLGIQCDGFGASAASDRRTRRLVEL